MPRPTGLLSLGLGLALGATATLALRHAHAPASAALSASGAASAPAIINHQSLIINDRLGSAEADSALDAYLALPPLPEDAPAAEIHARFSRLRTLLTILPGSHFERLFATLALRVGGPEARCRRIAFAVWTELDAPAAARWALAVVPGEAINDRARVSYLHIAAKAWAETDFDAAYAWVNSLSDSQLARTLAGPLLATLAAVDPTRALTLARAQGDDFFNANVTELFNAWAEKDPAAAVRTLGADALAQKNRARSVHQALAKWLSRDSAAAFAWIQSQPDESQSYYDTLLYSVISVGVREPASARTFADFIASHPELPNQRQHFQHVALNWPQDNKAGLLDWLRSQPQGEGRAKLAEICMPHLDTNGFMEALQFLPAGPDRDARLAARLSDWATHKPEAALAWIAAHDSPEVAAASAKIEGAVITHLALTDPAAAVSRLRALPDSPERAAAASPVALAWAKTDPAAALRFIAEESTRQPGADANTAHLQRATQSVAALMARQDPAAVMRWAESLSQPALRLSAYYALANDYDFDVGSTGHDATSVAHSVRADLLATIPDAQVREAPLSFVVANWLRRDYDAARSWIETHDALSPENAAKLLESTSPDNARSF